MIFGDFGEQKSFSSVLLLAQASPVDLDNVINLNFGRRGDERGVLERVSAGPPHVMLVVDVEVAGWREERPVPGISHPLDDLFVLNQRNLEVVVIEVERLKLEIGLN